MCEILSGKYVLFCLRHRLSIFSGTVDLLSAVNIHQEQIGVSKIVGFCENRAGTNIPDLAFRVQAESQLSVSTYPIFQGKSESPMISLRLTVIHLRFRLWLETSKNLTIYGP